MPNHFNLSRNPELVERHAHCEPYFVTLSTVEVLCGLCVESLCPLRLKKICANPFNPRPEALAELAKHIRVPKPSL